MTYVIKWQDNHVEKIGLVPSHGFSCTRQELPNEIWIRARAIHGVRDKRSITMCKKYGSRKTADLIAKSLETETTKYWRL